MSLRVKRLLERHTADAGGDLQDGLKRTKEDFTRLVRSDKVKPHEVSIRDLFETFVASKNPGEDLFNAKPERIAEAITASEFPFATGALIHQMVIPAYNYEVGPVMSLVTETTSNNEIEDIVGFGAVDRLEVVGPNEPYPQTRIDEKRVRITNYKLGHIITVNRETLVFDKTGEILTRARNVGQKAGQQLHEYIVTRCADLASALTGQAANTSLNFNGTNRALFSSDHSAWDTQTNDNLNTTALNTTGLTEMSTLLMKLLDRKGDRIIVTPTKLLVPPDLWVTATQLMRDSTQPDTADRAGNVFRGAYNIIVSPFLTDTNDWFLGDFARQMRLQWVWRPEVTTMGTGTQLAFDRDWVFQAKFSMMMGVGATDYRFAARAQVT